MPPDRHSSQRIGKLAPLAEVLHKIDALAQPVKPQERALSDALGCVLARDVALAAAHPARAIALIDGFTVRAEEIADAGPYAPVAAPAEWVEAGDALPAGMDAVLPPDAMNDNDEATAPAGAGEGVWPAGADGAKGAVLGQAGERLRATDIAAMQALGVRSVAVRAPKIRLAAATGKSGAALALIARMTTASGGEAGSAGSLNEALADEHADAVVVIGGSGMGRSDASVSALAQAGRVEAHGIGLRPGETAAIGGVGSRPVLIVPGRLDATLAVFSLLGLRLIAKLAGRAHYISQMPVQLTRKVASQAGIAEFVPLGRTAKNAAEPLATGTIALSALARMDGWLFVPAESEGYPAGATVDMRLFP